MLKSIIVDQIVAELQMNSNKSETLNKMLDQFPDTFILSCMDDVSKVIFECSLPDFDLKQGMLIRAKKDLFGKSTNWNSPEKIIIPKDTLFRLSGTASNGDVFVELLEGTCHFPDKTRTYEPSTHPRLKTTMILNEGQIRTTPYSFGKALKECWQIVE